VFVTAALFDRLQSEGQLAGVLGHEIGHVVRRHSVQQMQQQQGAQFGVTLGCVLAPSICNSGLGSTAINVGATAVFAKFSRNDEAEADQVGIDYTRRAGIDPRGIPQMFRILMNERQSRPGGVEAFFQTHPLEEDRITATEATIAKIPSSVLASLTKDSQNFHTFQARVRAQPAAPQARAGGQ
jgi:predicted Zn-dependent protease